MPALGQLTQGRGPVTSGSVASSLTPDAAVGAALRDVTVTGSSVSVAAPTNPENRQVLEYAFYAQVATTVTFASGIRLSTGLTSRAFAVPVGEMLFVTLQYSTLDGAWAILGAAVTVT